jgi:hypothetical protein
MTMKPFYILCAAFLVVGTIMANITTGPGGSGGGGATIPSTANVLVGNGSGNAADSGIIPASVVTNGSTTYAITNTQGFNDGTGYIPQAMNIPQLRQGNNFTGPNVFSNLTTVSNIVATLFTGDGSTITNLTTAPSAGSTNIVAETASGALVPLSFTGFGSGSSFPLTGNVSAAGFSITAFGIINSATNICGWLSITNGLSALSGNFSSLVVTNALTIGTLTATNLLNYGGPTNYGVNVIGIDGTGTNWYQITNVFQSPSNPTNQFTTGTLYTNPNQRSLLVGSAVLNGGVSGSANITLFYTNNGVGYALPIQTGAGVATTDIMPFNVPLSTNATYRFVSTMGTGATGYLTNVVNFLQ